MSDDDDSDGGGFGPSDGSWGPAGGGVGVGGQGYGYYNDAVPEGYDPIGNLIANLDNPAFGGDASAAAQAAQAEADRSLAERNSTWGQISSFLGLPTSMDQVMNDPQTVAANALKSAMTSPTGIIGGMYSIEKLISDLTGAPMTDPDIDAAQANKEANPSAGGNVDAMRAFLQGGATPTFDPQRAAQALTNALNGISEETTSRNLVGKGYEDPAVTQAQNIFNSFGAGSDYDSLLNEQLGKQFADSAFDTAQTGQRNTFTNNVNTALPDNQLFDTDSFNSMVDSFLNNKFNDASAEIGRSAARGNLSGSGVDIAQNNLRSQRDAATNTARTAGQSILDQDNTDYSTIRNNALSGANSYILGQPDFDVTPFTSQRDTLKATDTQGFNDSLSNLLGSQTLFDPNAALQAGGAGQGQVSGTQNGSVLDALADRQDTQKQDRGLGSSGSGVF